MYCISRLKDHLEINPLSAMCVNRHGLYSFSRLKKNSINPLSVMCVDGYELY